MNPLLETIVIIIVPILFIILGMGIVPFAQKKGWLKSENAKLTEQMLVLFRALVNKNLSNSDLKNNALLIHDSIINALQYVQNIIKYANIDEKKEIAYNYAIAELYRYGIELDEDDKKIVEILIDNVIDLVENK